MVDPNKCSGCRTCELICSWSHNQGVVRPSLSRVQVLKKEDLAINTPMFCLQCELAFCKEVCPVHAISKDKNTGALMINQDTCIGCRACLMVCPFGAIGQDPETRIMLKCDLCGGDPKCVQWCPNEAIQYEEAQVLASSKQRQMVEEHIVKGLLGARK